jgi:hypothetical protein
MCAITPGIRKSAILRHVAERNVTQRALNLIAVASSTPWQELGNANAVVFNGLILDGGHCRT